MQENNSIGYHIVNAEKLIGRYILDKFNKKAQHRVSPVQVMIMKYLLKNQNKKIFQQDICDAFNLRRSTVSGILTTMEKNNIIIRENVKDDNKSKEIKLTDDVYKRANDLVKELKELDLELLKDVNKEDLEVFMRVLKNIQDNLKEERK